ncbi:MAG: carbohydrate ABC transporter permease [Candidatus Borkfalkiaceae bacterium]|nr:carbohydrate ABC transporter permease [Christensenellaceae bacterium]
MTSKIKKSYYRLDFQIVICIIVIAATLFSFLSLSITIINSLKSNDEIITNIFALPKASLLGENIAFNFSHAWEAVKTSFISSIILSLIGAFFNCLLGSVLAYVFAYKDFYFKEFFFMMFLSVMLLPSIMGMPVLVPFVKNTLHLGETYIGYLLPNFAGGQVGALFLFRTFFCQQPKSIYESAQIEGANDLHIYLHIAIPLSWAIILFHFVGVFGSYYNDYLWPSLILGNKMTLMPKMLSQQETFNSLREKGSMYAMYMISCIPLVITSTISMKYFKGGEFAAGMKL